MKLLSLDYNSFSIDGSVFEDGIFKMHFNIREEDLVQLIQAYAHVLANTNITDVCIEQLYLGPNAMTVKKLALVHSSIVYKTLELNVKLHQVYVAHWHSMMLDKGNRSSKKDALAKANELLGFSDSGYFVDHNAADSYLIGLCWLRENAPEVIDPAVVERAGGWEKKRGR